MGQHDKEWGELVTPLADRKEEWWAMVMEVGLDPELTEWSVHLGSAIVLTGNRRSGGQEHVWLIAIDYHAATGTAGTEYKGDQRPKAARLLESVLDSGGLTGTQGRES